MGLFDTIHVPKEIFEAHTDPRLNALAKASAAAAIPLQTYDFENFLTDFYLVLQETRDYLLYKTNVELEAWVTQEDTSASSGGYFPVTKKASVLYEVNRPIYGHASIYGFSEELHAEVVLTFDGARLLNIECISFSSVPAEEQEEKIRQMRVKLQEAENSKNSALGRVRTKLRRTLYYISDKLRYASELVETWAKTIK